MAVRYEDLDEITRSFMISEIEGGPHYQSPRLTPAGLQRWPTLLREAAGHHNDDWIARQCSH